VARYCKVGFIDTLISIFFFRIVDNWAAMPDADLQTRVYTVARRMYADLNASGRGPRPRKTCATGTASCHLVPPKIGANVVVDPLLCGSA